MSSHIFSCIFLASFSAHVFFRDFVAFLESAAVVSLSGRDLPLAAGGECRRGARGRVNTGLQLLDVDVLKIVYDSIISLIHWCIFDCMYLIHWCIYDSMYLWRLVIYSIYSMTLTCIASSTKYDWVILFGPMLGFIFQHHGAYGCSRRIHDITL